MNNTPSALIPAQQPSQVPNPDTQHNNAMQTAVEFAKIKNELGLSFIVKDKNFNNISGKFKDLSQLLKSPEFIAHLDQELYVCDLNETTWFKLKLKKGRIISFTFLLNVKINWFKVINKDFGNFDFIHVGFGSKEDNTDATSTLIPYSDVTPDKIAKHFKQLVGQTANNSKELGKLLCYILTKYLTSSSPRTQEYHGKKQGFERNLKGEIQFNPAHLLPKKMLPYLPAGIKARQYPPYVICQNEDITPILTPLYTEQKEFQLVLLHRIASWHQSFFVQKDVCSDSTLIIKLGTGVSITLAIVLLKNTRYDSLDVPPIGPNIKPLKFELETVNDGMVVAVDVYAADQFKKAEKGYDLLINDTSGATGEGETVHHISVLISGYADMYFPKDKCCVLELGDVSTRYSPEAYKTALKRLDANLIIRTERGCNNGNFIKVFNGYVDEIRNNIPDTIPNSKHNTYIMLNTALRMYNEFFSPLFAPDIEQYIVEWLCSQEQDKQPLYDVICTEFGKILNKKIADGYFRLILKEETTPFDKGSHTLVVDKDKRCIYLETAESLSIAKNEMNSIGDSDSLTSALYSCGYLPHNAKSEKSIRIAAITSDGVPYPLYVHAISYSLLTQENKLRFDLLDKEANLFSYDEIPRESFLPLIKTIDGRFAGKMLRYEAEESNIYFGTGRTGSGKSWAIAQILPMLFMLGHIVVVFDASGSYTKEKLLKMLPSEVVEKLFKFINIGVGMDLIPIDLGSLRGCETLPDKKRAIYSVIRAATGSLDKSASRKLKGFLSEYLKDKKYFVNLNALCSKLEKTPGFGAEIANCVQSVLDDIKEVGFAKQDWEKLLSEHKIIVVNLGNEVGDSTHQLLDMMVGSLFNWQMKYDSKFLSIAIDELIDQDFSMGSPLQTIVKQGRKFHTALIGATQDYFNQGSSHLDVMKQANINSFCRPGKSADRIAQKLDYSNAVDAGFNNFKAGDEILEFDGYNKETGENEALTIKGRVVDFINTPLYEKFKKIYGYNH